MIISKQQEALLFIAREKGYVTLVDAEKVYSSHTARKNALKRLVSLGLLRVSSVPNRFEVVS